jgi:L-fuconolactonase
MFLLEFAEENAFIKGVVGWVDLKGEAIKERLQYFKHFTKLKGFRHVLQAEAPEFMLQPDFLRGIQELGKAGYTYDILIFPKHLEAATRLVKLFPDQPFVIDHIAKPYIKQGLIDEWRKDITTLAQFPNVYCKISGMVTEADFSTWKPEDFTPYLDVVVGAFGISRIMYGSDWPVCLVAASYTQMMHIVKDYFAAFSKEEQALFFGGNAVRFYRL